MNTSRYGTFYSRLALSVVVWTVFLGAICVVGGFRVMPGDRQLSSVVAVWLAGLMHVTPGLPAAWNSMVIGGRAIALCSMFVLPPFTATWASPVLETGHLPGEKEADFSDPRTHRPFLFYLPLWRYLYLDQASCWRAGSHTVCWVCAAVSSSQIGLPIGPAFFIEDFTNSQTAAATYGRAPTSAESIWIFVLWNVFFWLLPGAVRRIFDWRATRRALLNQQSKEGSPNSCLP